MPDDSAPLQPFNLDTMSGVYPGTRTPIYQRLRLQSLHDTGVRWFQVLWGSEPAGAVLVERGTAYQPVLQLPDLLGQHALLQALSAAVSGAGLRLTACGTCAHWQPTSLLNDDGVPLGRCRWQMPLDAGGGEPLPDALGLQSCLALDCAHHVYTEAPVASGMANAPAAAQAERPHVPKSAELDLDRLPFWPRQWRKLRSKFEGVPKPDQDPDHPIIERSGVGAGTESCFVCQGRIANLGALAVESPEGDKQTLSVWRCRLCHTTYFNDWIDRWERLDSLETEERYYRIAPAEALAALTLIRSVAGGDHPAGRQDRHAIRTRLLSLVQGQEPLSHQIRQGR